MSRNSFLFSRYETAARFVRQRLGVSRLTKEQAQEVREAVEKHQRREGNSLRGDVLFARKHVRITSVQNAITEQVRELFLENYRHSQSKWAGGENAVMVRSDERAYAMGMSRKAWSDNGKWSGTTGYFEINVQPKWRQQVLAVPGLAIAGGMLTTHAKLVSPGVWEATWLVQGRGFNVDAVSGFIVQVGDRFFHGETEAKAREALVRQAKQEELERKSGKIAAELRTLSVQEFIDRYGSLVISRADSIRCGNCESGTDSWILHHFEGATKATISEVLKADPSDRVLAACRAAALRQLKKPTPMAS